MPTIKLDNFNLGGVADSKYQGVQYSVAALVGFDIHSEPGVLKSSQKLTKDSGSTVTEFVKTIVSCSDGKAYLFSNDSGKVWSRASNGTYALATTLLPAAGSAACCDAIEWEGYLYYSMERRLGRAPITAGAVDWASKDDNYGTFTTITPFHPFQKLNRVLYAGDGNFMAQVTSGHTFTAGSADVLDLESQFRVKSVGSWLRKLLMGTYVSENVSGADVFKWDGWSVSFTSPDDLPEVGMHALLKIDNGLLGFAGYKGGIYQYDGEVFQPLRVIPGDWTLTNQAVVHPNAVEAFGKMSLFGLSKVTGSPAPMGIYEIGASRPGYARVLDLPYVISQGVTANIEIGAIEAISADTFLVSWKDTNSGTVYGVDKLDLTAKYSGSYFDSRLINMDRVDAKDFGVRINYRTLPSGTAITLSANEDNAGLSSVATITDADRRLVQSERRVAGSNTLEIRVATTANGNVAPEIESVELFF